ncbi:MAG: hypothetical protein U0360_09370, partial [Dehalococcoidia bacterium]
MALLLRGKARGGGLIRDASAWTRIEKDGTRVEEGREAGKRQAYGAGCSMMSMLLIATAGAESGAPRGRA